MESSTDTVTNFLADQIEAECAEARRLAPHNRFMRSHSLLGPRLDYALRHLEQDTIDGAERAEGSVPVVQIRHDGYRAHTRVGSQPIKAAVVGRCAICNTAQAGLAPFWLALGQYVAQIDTCGLCTDGLVLTHSAVMQVA